MKKLIKILIATAVVIFLINPAINPMLSDGMKAAVSNELRLTLGVLSGGAGSGMLSPAKLISALAVALITYIITAVMCFVVEKSSKGKGHGETVAEMVSSIVKTVGVIVGFVWVFSVLGVNLAAIFASLGIVSLIVGFGVQTLIEDCITGIFLILERQYDIGDIIVVEDYRGTVKKITMRTTTLRDDGGNLKIINNSDIRNIQNHSQQDSFATCDLALSYANNLIEIEKYLLDELPGMLERNKDNFEKAPVYSGVQELDPDFFSIRVKVDVKENNMFAAKRALNREMKLFTEKYDIVVASDDVDTIELKQ